ncbi:hypothetical protein G2W53_026296 [Senna tora]|uniref:Uncharacterized protein n=1 Tax=Senna tora TaxID=362788 RepID=A0A834TGQ3_9FABA|nr:hypothetical protein G2W53_026296 [Senna tora]
MTFAELKELIHRTLKLSQNQVVSEIIYRMPYGRNPINFLSAEVSDDEGMASMLHCHMQCLEFLPIPVIEICANTSAAMQPFEATDYIPHIEFNRRGEEECGTSQAFEGDDINEDSLEMAQEMLNMPTEEPNEELFDDEEFDALIGNDIEDPPSGAEYEDEDFVDNSDGDADDIQVELTLEAMHLRGYGDKAVMQSIYVGGILWIVGSDPAVYICWRQSRRQQNALDEGVFLSLESHPTVQIPDRNLYCWI